jgi:hypothetical protein
MARLPMDIPFDQWLDYLFGSPVGPSGFRESDDWWDEHEDQARTVAYLTRLFDGSGHLAGRYPHDQIDRGLWYLASESGHLSPLFESAEPWPARRRALLAIGNLYERLFAPTCSNYLGHLDRGPEPPNPLNSICYMWWDLFPTWGSAVGASPQSGAPTSLTAGRAPHRRRSRHQNDGEEAALHTIDDVLLHVMERSLRLGSEACREGALHGLGHWHLTYPEQTAAIIDRWLAEGPSISPELHAYARSARSGCVQ